MKLNGLKYFILDLAALGIRNEIERFKIFYP